MSDNAVKIAVAGAGLAGSRHIAAIRGAEEAALAAVADPGENGRLAAAREKVPHYESLDAALSDFRPDGVIVATPTGAHAAHGIACANAGIPALIEKPIAANAKDAAALVATARDKGVPILTGHHRRHNLLTAAAREVIDAGRLGRITAVHGQTWLMKPDDYFRAEWRRRKGAGPVFTNLIHDIDMLRHLCGEIESVHALESGAARGHEVEDTAAILLRFESGALGTVSVSDAIVAPWSWELTARDNPVYPATCEACYWIGGTHGSLSLPNLSLWRMPEARSWWAPIAEEKLVFDFGEDPFVRQIRHFAAVIRGDASPLVSGEEGMKSLAAVEAVKRSAETGRTIQLAHFA